MSTAQKWFILIWLAVVSIIGAVALVMDPLHHDVSGWVFGTPLGLLAMWGFAAYFSDLA